MLRSVETCCLTRRMESEVCLSETRLCLINTKLQLAHQMNKSQIKWRWTPWHVFLIDLPEPALVHQMFRV